MCAWLLLMCAGRFRLDFYPWCNFNFARHMFMHTYPFFSFYLFYWWCVSFLSLSLSLSLSLCASLSFSFSDRLRMAPKPKSTPTWNPLGSRSSSSDPPVPPLHVWFHDGKAQQDFLENFQKHGVHPECHVVLSHFSDTPLPAIIQTQGWESLYEIPLRCPIMFIQEFYSNIHGIDTSVPRFATTFWGTCIVVTPNLISKVLHVPWVLHLDYHGYQCL